LIETDLVGQLLRSLDSAIEQAKVQSSVERSQIAQVIQKQEDLRRATATYRQEGSEGAETVEMVVARNAPVEVVREYSVGEREATKAS